ncbi:MAG TPA: hypothetical protein VGW77_19485 [Candidatus Binatia bacterium]|nr:hypothetical protein [Candidatus Binatia bacterium]
MLLSQIREHAVHPAPGRDVVLDVTVDPRIKTRGPVTLKGSVELAAAFAEVIVSGVAKREHREFHTAQIMPIAVNDCFPERRGIIRRFAVAIGTGDDQHAVCLRQYVRLTMGHVPHPYSVASAVYFGSESMGQQLRVASDGAVENQYRVTIEKRRMACSLGIMLLVRVSVRSTRIHVVQLDGRLRGADAMKHQLRASHDY